MRVSATAFCCLVIVLSNVAAPGDAQSSPICRMAVAAVFPSATGATVAVAVAREGSDDPISGATVRLMHGLTAYDVNVDTVRPVSLDGSLAGATPIVVRVPELIDGAYVSAIGGTKCAPYRPWTSTRQSSAGAADFVAKIGLTNIIDARPAGTATCREPDVSVSEVEHIPPDVSKIAANYGQRSVRTTVIVTVGPDGRAIDAQLSHDTLAGTDLANAAILAARQSRYRPTRFRCVASIDDFTQIYEFIGR